MTIAEKLLARASGRTSVAPGETLFVRTDLAMCHDAVAGPTARIFFREFGDAARVTDPTEGRVRGRPLSSSVNDIRVDPDATRPCRGEMGGLRPRAGLPPSSTPSPRAEAAGICHVLLPEEGSRPSREW
jgi:homoaconitase/3-isopropylmalate dehydratase large subunit